MSSDRAAVLPPKLLTMTELSPLQSYHHHPRHRSHHPPHPSCHGLLALKPQDPSKFSLHRNRKLHPAPPPPLAAHRHRPSAPHASTCHPTNVTTPHSTHPRPGPPQQGPGPSSSFSVNATNSSTLASRAGQRSGPRCRMYVNWHERAM
jgi:hypothetical protein